MKILLTKTQLPFEILHVLGKVLQMVVSELSEAKGANKGSVDADAIAPYLTLVIILAVGEVYDDLLRQRGP